MSESNRLQNLQTTFAAWPPARRAAFAASALGSLAFFLWIGFGSTQGGYGLLFGGVSAEEMSRIVETLKEERVPYRLESGGTAVYVPTESVHEARIRLAGRGLPSGGGAGFELFDKPDFGVTDFVHRVNFRRALQGELARSIAQLDPVHRARVQIAIPERSPFIGDDSRNPSASVVVQLRSGSELSRDQVRGVVHLVSSSVASLAAERVTVVDQRGRLLAPAGDEVDAAQPSGTGDYQAQLERELSHRIQALLEPAVGGGRLVATVRADLDWTQTEHTRETFDPESQIERSEQRTVESEQQMASGPSGVPGVRSNLPGGTGSSLDASGNQSTRTVETINYEISKTVSRSVEPAGTITRLTVAVLLDGKPTGDGTFEAWDEQSLTRFEELAKRAVGFNEERGDQLTLSTAPFLVMDFEPEAEGFDIPPQVFGLVSDALRVLAGVIVLLLFGRLVVKPLLGTLGSIEGTALPARVSDLEAQLAGGGNLSMPGGTEDRTARAPIEDLARERSEDGAKTLQGWLGEG